MEIDELRNCAYTLMNDSQMLIDKYQRIVQVLNNISKIIDGKLPNSIRIVNNLIDRYDGLIKLINSNFIDSANAIIKYSDSLSDNLNDLAIRLGTILRNTNFQPTKYNIESL